MNDHDPPKKYQKKRDMRALKARYRAFEQLQVDTKYLTDIPFYVEQLYRHSDLPRYQYTCRDVKTDGVLSCTGTGVSSVLMQYDFKTSRCMVRTTGTQKDTNRRRQAQHRR